MRKSENEVERKERERQCEREEQICTTADIKNFSTKELEDTDG